MRILHILNHARKANGHVELAVDLACEQAAQGHTVGFASGHNDFSECLALNGVSVFPIGVDGRIKNAAILPFHLFSITKKFNPDIVNSHMVTTAVAAKFIQPVSNFKLITTVHNPFDRQAKLMEVGDRIIALSVAVRDELVDNGMNASRMRVVTNGTVGGARRPHNPERELDPSSPSDCHSGGITPPKRSSGPY